MDAGADAAAACALCGEPVRAAALAPDLLDELLGMSAKPAEPAQPAPSPTSDPALLREPAAHPPAPPSGDDRTSTPPPDRSQVRDLPVVLLSVQDAPTAGPTGSTRTAPMESGIVDVASAEAMRSSAAKYEIEIVRPSAPPPCVPPEPRQPHEGDGEIVSALPPVVTIPPSDLVQPNITFGLKSSPRDSVDDGWDVTSPPVEERVVPVPAAPIAPDVLPALVQVAPQTSEHAEAQAAAADGDDDGGGWAPVPDESLAEDVPGPAAVREAAASPGEASAAGPATGATHALSAAPPPLNEAAVSAVPSPLAATPGPREPAIPFPDFGATSPSVSPVVQAALAELNRKSAARRLAPFAGAAAVLGAALYWGLASAENPPSDAKPVAAVAPARTATEEPKAAEPPPEKPPEPAAAPPETTPAAESSASEPTSEPEPAAEKPRAKFSQRAANAALARAIKQARSCRKPGGPTGTAQAAVTFATSGKVEDVTVTGAKIAGTPLAECIGETLREASVPAFSGEPVTIKKTMKFR